MEESPANLIANHFPHSQKTKSTLLHVGLTTLILLYALQLFSPLRVNTDALSLLRLASQLTDGKPFLMDGARPVYPIGVPRVFSMMERIGMAHAWGFALFNFGCLLIGGIATVGICRGAGRSTRFAIGVVLVAFANYVLFKHSVIPLTDLPHMAAVLTCVWCLDCFDRHDRGYAKYLTLALAALAPALLTRRTGVALVPAFAWAMRPREKSRDSRARFSVASGDLEWSITAGALALAIVVFVLPRVLYVPDFHSKVADHIPSSTLVVLSHLQELGSLTINLPVDKPRALTAISYAAGLVLVCVILSGLQRARANLRPMHVYLAAYMAMLFLWPYKDARFWIPVLPLLVIVAGDGLRMDRPAVRRGLAAYLAVYFALGMAAAVYTTRITFSGSKFPQIYGSGSFRAAYETAWFNGVDSDPRTSAVIERYGR